MLWSGGREGKDLASVLSIFAPKQRRTSLVNPTDTLLSSPRSRFRAPPNRKLLIMPTLGLSSLAVPLINESTRLMTASPILLVNSPLDVWQQYGLHRAPHRVRQTTKLMFSTFPPVIYIRYEGIYQKWN